MSYSVPFPWGTAEDIVWSPQNYVLQAEIYICMPVQIIYTYSRRNKGQISLSALYFIFTEEDANRGE